ncbi:hypothetical protein FS837_001148 [Tulasnella sp. UAMH 9824]|nr:hypothetical protein FS837_001148 [Tulasnella sp. UAMH 9824]
MRRAAQEAETMSNMMKDASIPNETKSAFQQRNADFTRLLTSGAAGAGAFTSSASSSALCRPASHCHPAIRRSVPLPPRWAQPPPHRSRNAVGPQRGLEVDEDGNKRRTRPELRDPNAPKHPASAHILYQNGLRVEFREEHRELTYRELLKGIPKTWQNLDPVETQRYQAIVDKGRAVYTVQKKAYDMAHGGSNAASPITTTTSIVPPPTTTLRVPSANHHHSSLMAPLNGGGMTPTSSHSRHSSEEEESEEEESEDNQRRVHTQHAHGITARHYHHTQEE